MGRKRKAEIDGIAFSGESIKREPCSEESHSDESLHLPEEIFDGESSISPRKRKKKKERIKLEENGLRSPEAAMHNVCAKELEDCDSNETTNDSTRKGRLELYLIRKPVEISFEELSKSRISVRSCFSGDEKVVIGDKCFLACGTKTATQMYHIPTEIIHSSKIHGLPVSGIVTLSKTEVSSSTVISEEDGSTSNFAHDLTFKVIRKKVSRKSIRNLKQRLRANGCVVCRFFKPRRALNPPSIKTEGLDGVDVAQALAGDVYDIESRRASFVLWEWDREAGERSVMTRAISQLEIAHKLADD
ncbi:hypothetical protein KIN20_034380 [Parelaphostrongylus tenuis]|uniref:Uncharacterized protein n=1 Tax=Parelaphostrongylus tenuis TaxID=148309 RepID=A0AAD5RA24_PARTN|nr:hypothetical protein KIN20_034380 [Parelaphostrongylus tenuis]